MTAMNGGWAEPEALKISGEGLTLLLFVVSTITIEFVVLKLWFKQPQTKTLGAVLLANVCSYVAGVVFASALWGQEIELNPIGQSTLIALCLAVVLVVALLIVHGIQTTKTKEATA